MTARETETRQRWLEYRERLDALDAPITSLMDRWSVPALRAALGVVFIWFGGLKVLPGTGLAV